MFEISVGNLIILFFITVFGQTFSTAIGGGGFFVQTGMLALGIPPHLVVANETASYSGTSFGSLYVFNKNNYLEVDLIKWWLPGIVVGPMIGAQLLAITPAVMMGKIIALICIVGSAYLLFFAKKLGRTRDARKPEDWKWKSITCGLLLGVYFGFIGAGGSIVSSLMLYGVFRLSLKHTLGTRNLLHLPITLVSTGSYYFLGLIHWPIFLTMFVGSLIAGWLGSTIAVKVPTRILKPIFFSAIFGLALYMLLS